uniref:Retrovirus-related Pol polyprotein from transposon TNT 1-94 n=1 Tax=Tanacetum cinerariifolium TaxID=118510 RepID=A0A699I8Y7_TANCI|nr:retrovirus-related Pol polyprotein from transposon TNT 1-94 [Tanacetum cinerariifolium]
MVAVQKKPETQLATDERKAANLDLCLKSLIIFVLLDDQINSVINCLTVKSTWVDLILYHEGPYDVKESRVMDLKLCYNTFKFKEGKSLTQNFIKYQALMKELVNDGIKLSKLEINTGFINGLPKKWLSLCQSLRNTNRVKDSELASLFGKLKYEENLIDNIYETKKNKSPVSTTPLSTTFFSTSIVQDFQDSPDDEKDIRSSHEYLNDLEEEYQERALLAKQTKDFEAKCHKVKAKLALLSSSALIRSSSSGKNKGLITETYDWDTEEVSFDENEVTEVKVLMALTDEERVSVGKESAKNGKWTKISVKKGNESSVCVTLLLLLKMLDSVEPISELKTIKSILKSKSTFKDETLKEPSSAPARDKSSLASKTNSALAGKLKNVKMEDDPPLAIGESSLRSRPSRPSVSFPSCIHCGYNNHNSNDCAYYPTCEICGSYDHDTHGHNRIISLRRGINPRNPQHVTKNCETCGSNVHTTSDHNEIK